MRLFVVGFCAADTNRVTFLLRSLRCLVFRPVTRRLQRSQLFLFSCLRISNIIWGSDKPNCASMASKGVRSSQAIPIIRSISWGCKSGIVCDMFLWIEKLFCVSPFDQNTNPSHRMMKLNAVRMSKSGQMNLSHVL